MTKKTVLVTGGTRGIGKETARGLARLGATVIIVGRDEERGAAAAAELRETTATSASSSSRRASRRRPRFEGLPATSASASSASTFS